MTISDLISYVRQLTKTTSYQFSDNELMSLVKIWLHKVQRAVAMARADYFGTKDYTIVNVNQEDIPLPDDCLELKAVDICYNADKPVEQQIWYRGKEIDIGQDPNTWEDIQKNTPKEQPVFDILEHRLWVAPIRAKQIGDDAVVKIRLWYIEQPPDPTSLTDTPLISTIDKSLTAYQPIIGLGVAYDVLHSLGSPRATEFLQRYNMDLGNMVKEIKQQNISAITGSRPYNDGSQY